MIVANDLIVVWNRIQTLPHVFSSLFSHLFLGKGLCSRLVFDRSPGNMPFPRFDIGDFGCLFVRTYSEEVRLRPWRFCHRCTVSFEVDFRIFSQSFYRKALYSKIIQVADICFFTKLHSRSSTSFREALRIWINDIIGKTWCCIWYEKENQNKDGRPQHFFISVLKTKDKCMWNYNMSTELF